MIKLRFATSKSSFIILLFLAYATPTPAQNWKLERDGRNIQNLKHTLINIAAAIGGSTGEALENFARKPGSTALEFQWLELLDIANKNIPRKALTHQIHTSGNYNWNRDGRIRLVALLANIEAEDMCRELRREQKP